MKKLLCFFIIGLGFMTLSFCTNAKPKEAIIEIKSGDLQEVTLMHVVDGSLSALSKASQNESGNILFKWVPEENGFYALRGKGIEQKIIYIKNGEKISLIPEDGKFRFSGKISKANNILEEWRKLTEEVRQMSINPIKKKSTYDEFFKAYRQLEQQTENLLKKIKTGDKTSDKLLKSYIDYEKGLFPLSYTFLPKRVSDPNVYDAYPADYLKLIDPDRFSEATILQMPFGIDYMIKYTYVAISLNKQEFGNKDTMLSQIKNPTAKGAFLIHLSQGIKTYLEAEQTYEKYRDLFNESQDAAFRRILDRLDKARIRTDFVDFSYPDKDGKRFSVADFKGKVILLDYWATWCQPCIKEIPYLKELKEYFKGKDIVFIGISVDRSNARQKWETFIKDNELPGYQLFSEEGEGKTIEHYQINSIPRFMIIGKDGKLAAPNAPKPSDPILKQLLEEELKR